LVDVIADSDVVVVGSGLAGISAALAATRLGVSVTLVTDGAVGKSNSVMAQGGIQLPRDDRIDVESMVTDMLAVGGDEADEQRIRRFVDELPALTSSLEELGLVFDRDEAGELMRRSAGGLSSPRIATVGDQIGRPLMKLLRSQVVEECDVITGASVHSVDVGEGIDLSSSAGVLRARAAVIATGGVSYQEAVDTDQLTSNPPNDNAILRASLDALGLRETEPRRFQWHPFGIVASRRGVTVSCIPESVAALGPRLVTDEGVEVSGLPAPRSEVVAAMRTALDTGATVHLTLEDISPGDLARFPQVQRYVRDYGMAATLTPVLHYELSGYEVAPDQASGLPGLYLAGEIVGGIHGRERLMGAGVADSLVHGRRAGESAARSVTDG
jgi:succinate dehydrogenase / fumarate reductase flavoprotein subunit